eukprot:gene5650-9466_t
MVSKKYNKESHMLKFSSVFSNDKVKEHFQHFLKSEFNEEPFNCLLEIDELEKLQEEKSIIKKSISILKVYLMDNSKQAVNISSEKKIELLNKFGEQISMNDRWVISEKPSEIFGEIKKSLKQELQHDTFKRFVRTPACEKIIKKFISDESVVVPKMTRNFNLNTNHFRNNVLEDVDFDFAFEFMKDDFSWEMVGSKKSEDHINCFYSNMNYLPDLPFPVSGAKYECIVPHSVKDICLSSYTMDLAYSADTTIKNIKCFDFKTFDDLKKYFKDSPEKIQKYSPRENCSFKVAIKLPKPMNYRITKISTSYFYDKESKTFIYVGKSFVNDDECFLKQFTTSFATEREGSEKKQKAYNIFSYIAVIIKEIDVNKCTFVQLNLVNPGGWAYNETLMKYILYDRGVQIRKTLLNNIVSQSQEEKVKKFNQINMDEKTQNFDGMAKLLSNINFDE